MFALTISPTKKLADPKILHKIYLYKIVPHLNKCSRHYILYPEFSYDGRLHYHGVIDIHDWIKFQHIRWNIEKIGFIKLDKLKSFKDHLRWLIYCTKNYSLLNPIIHKRKLPKFIEKEPPRRPTVFDYGFAIENSNF